MHYSLWHLETGNVIGDFDSRDAAIAGVRDEIQTNDDLNQLMLEADDPSEDPLFGFELERLLEEDRPSAIRRR